jgi:hypothetical protein
MKYAVALAAFFLLPVAPALAGPLGTFQDFLTAPDAGYMTKGLAMAGTLFATLITCSIVVRLGRLAWSNHGDFNGWHTELGDLLWNVMVPGYATLLGANILLPQIQAIIDAIATGVTGHPGIAHPDAVLLLGVTTAMKLIGAAVAPLTGAGATTTINIGPFHIPIPNYGLDTVWMTLVNLIIAMIAAFGIVLSLTRVAFELIAAIAGGMYAISINAIAVAFSASGATKEVSGRYINAVWMVIMNVVSIAAYAAIVTDLFGAVKFQAGLLHAGTFVSTVFGVLALSWAVGAGAKRVASIGNTLYAGGSFITAGHVANEAMAAPKAAARAAYAAIRLLR